MTRRFCVAGLSLVFCAILTLPVDAAEKIRVACIGDSITFGAGVEQREKNNYPVKLGELLGDKYEVKNFGVSGATLLKHGDLPYWKLGEFKASTEWQPNIVVIKLGTNDTKPQNWKFAGEYATDLAALVDHFSKLNSKPRVYLCKPVPVYEAKWGINEQDLTQGVMPKLVAVAKEKEVQVIDLYTALSGAPQYFPDKIHPNAAGAAVIAKTVFAAISEKK
ncbi:MAG TPA: GDSL-type esterase/lipase family protein [Pirellulaceae bacterium]|nr:GDSL-type esterase/lipase family protein [Pirellulaceae bacterium]